MATKKCDPDQKAQWVQAIIMKRKGASIRKAAKALGVSPSTIQDAVRRAKQKGKPVTTPPPAPAPAPAPLPPAQQALAEKIADTVESMAVDALQPPPGPAPEILGKIPEAAPAGEAPPVNPCPPESAPAAGGGPAPDQAAPAPQPDILGPIPENPVPPEEQVEEVKAVYSAVRQTTAQAVLWLRGFDLDHPEIQKLISSCGRPSPIALLCLKANAPRLFGYASKAVTGLVPIITILTGDICAMLATLPEMEKEQDGEEGAPPAPGSVSDGGNPSA